MWFPKNMLLFIMRLLARVSRCCLMLSRKLGWRMCLHDLCLSVSNGKLGSGCPGMIIAMWCSGRTEQESSGQCVRLYDLGRVTRLKRTLLQQRCVEKVQLQRKGSKHKKSWLLWISKIFSNSFFYKFSYTLMNPQSVLNPHIIWFFKTGAVCRVIGSDLSSLGEPQD